MPVKQVNQWRKAYPECLFANLYGPTEITDVCCYYILDREFDEEEALPIGKACENTEVLIITEDNRLAVGDEQGEICVRGTCLALGYYSNREKTEKVFVQNPLHNRYEDKVYRTGDLAKYNDFGEIIYLGRMDNQIKHQGYRIELGEIETAVSSISGIKQNCAIYNEKAQQIVVCCTADNCTEKIIYQILQQRLPKYMLPARIVILDQMPLNANGKINRLKLKEKICGR